MKKIIGVIALTLAALNLSAQQNIKSESIESFVSVTLSGNLKVELIPSYRNAIDVVLYDLDISRFKWGVSDGDLNMNLRQVKNQGSADVKIYYMDSLQNISVSGVEMLNNEPIMGGILKISVSGGSKVTTAVNAPDLEIEVSGNSVLQASGGEARYLSLKASERSRLDTREIDSMSAVADATTGAEIYVYANERLVTSAKTNATIFYKGEPQIFKNRTALMNLGASVLSIGN